MTPTVYLVSGANRGIGLGIVDALAKRENVVVFAGARDPSSSAKLQDIAKAQPDKVYIVKLLSSDKVNNERAVEEIKKTAGRLDVVIANAGISKAYKWGAEVTPEEMTEHFNVNTLGPLVLFQAAWPVLQVSTGAPKFVPISSGAGSITSGTRFPQRMIAYGASKAALNYVTRKLYGENKNLIAFPICPGPVETDMLQSSFEQNKALAQTFKPNTVEESVQGILREVDSATRETHGNVFVRAEGGKWDW